MDAAPTARLPRRVAVLVAATSFMEFLDGTIISTAAPDMGRSLHVAPEAISVAITSYLLTLAVLIPLSGWLAERFGTRRVMFIAVVVFTVASGLCAASPSLPVLAALRVVQGAGGAMMVPVGRLVVLLRTPKDDLVRAIALLTWPALAAPVIAPLLGGLLTTYLSWHWIFLVNLPIGVVLAVGTLMWLPEHRRDDHVPMDWRGFLLTACSLSAVVVATSALGSTGGGPWSIGGAVVVAVATGAAAVRHLRRTDHPLLDLAVLRIPTFRLCHVSGGLYRATVFAVPFVLPLLLQVGLGLSAVHAGALVMLVFVGNLGIKPVTTPLLRHVPFRAVMIGASSVVAVTMLLCGTLTADTPQFLVAVLLLVSGAARSIGFTAYMTLGFADVPAPTMPAANTLSATTQQLAGGLGVAVGAVAIQAADVLTTSDSPATVYRWAFVVIAVLTLAVVPPAWRLPADAGARVRAGAVR